MPVSSRGGSKRIRIGTSQDGRSDALSCRRARRAGERDELAQEDTIALLKGESEKANALEDTTSRMEEMKKHERLTTRCTSQESKIAILEKENKLLNDGQQKGKKQVDSTLVNLKAKIEHLEEEMDKRRKQCQS
jgi:hypothetical protein